MLYPRYIRTQNQLGQPEWLVRNLNTEYVNDQGVSVKTPIELLNRYYRHDQHLPLEYSVLQGRMYLTYEQIPKNKNTVEYDSKYFLHFKDLTNEEILNRQLPCIIDAYVENNTLTFTISEGTFGHNEFTYSERDIVDITKFINKK
jgi:hypothetical protein